MAQGAHPAWGGPAPGDGHAALNEAVRRLRAPVTIRQRCGAITDAVYNSVLEAYR